jgi:putative ABC transport system permease protein
MRYFGSSQQANGRMVGLGQGDDVKPDNEIIGVVPIAKYASIRELPTVLLYLPFLQDNSPSDVTFYIHTYSDSAVLTGEIRNAVAQVEPGLPIQDLTTLDAQVNKNLWIERLTSVLSMSFCTLATVLAAIGLYAVVAFSVTQRTREIGIRMALGADQSGVVKAILTDVLILASAGLGIGLPLSLVLSHYLQSLLFDVSGHDPVVLLVVLVALSLVIVVSAWIPARRASRINPVTALNAE